VAKSAFSTSTPAPVMRLSSEDLPALVYPTMAIEGIWLRRRSRRLISRPVFMSAISRRIFAIFSRMRRRSVSILVSPGPRVAMPPPALPEPPPPICRDSD
jgi:hypothetical protein